MENKMMPEHMLYSPAVFAVGNSYQIFIPFDCPATVKIITGNREYYDDSNGILRSDTTVHKITVPMKVLDEAAGYTVCFREMIEHKPYFPFSSEERRISFDFRPIPPDKEDIRIYLISDTHNMSAEPIAAGQYFGDSPDLLILNGDVPDHSGSPENFNTVFAIIDGITHGSVPVVFSRGNHDTRGLFAEKFIEFTPSFNNKTYYTFRLGPLWGIVLDCGEDKDDSHEAYAGTVCFHDFRLKETEFIRSVIDNSEQEYNAPGVTRRIIVCHIPFTYTDHPPFDIEKDIYSEWARLLREHIKPDVMLFGHMHTSEIWRRGCKYDSKGQSADAVIAGVPEYNKDGKNRHTGAAVTLGKDQIEVVFNDSDDNIIGKETIAYS
ncbi:MAG: metallophosphoesterase family protein [Eubacteriales bacterium]